VAPMIKNRTDTPANVPMTFGNAEDLGDVDVAPLELTVFVGAVSVDVSVNVGETVVGIGKVDVADSGGEVVEEELGTSGVATDDGAATEVVKRVIGMEPADAVMLGVVCGKVIVEESTVSEGTPLAGIVAVTELVTVPTGHTLGSFSAIQLSTT